MDKFQPGDIIRAIADYHDHRDITLWVYKNDHGANKYTIFDPLNKTMTWEPKNLLNANYEKIGTATIEMIETLYL